MPASAASAEFSISRRRDFPDLVLVAAKDGAGSKVKIAASIMIDLAAMCVNDLGVQGAKPLFFLDYYATVKFDPAAGAGFVKGMSQGCIEAAERVVYSWRLAS